MSSIYRIADLTLDTGQHKILRGGEELPLGALTYKLLLELAKKSPDLVTHDDIADAVWDGRPVSPETVKQRVKLLRDAIADDAEHPQYIEAIRGQGYRLIPRAIQTDPPAAGGDKSRRLVTVGVALALVAAGALTLMMERPEQGPAPGDPSIAVLPFADMSPAQDHEYFAHGVSEEILNTLSTATSLRVIARTSSFAFRQTDIATIAEKLDVTHVLDGSVRKWGDRMRITVQLIDASDSTQLWSAAFEEDIGDVLTLQATIAKSVVDSLRANLLGESTLASDFRKQVNPQAFDMYLRGQQQLRLPTAESLLKAEEFFLRAIEHDPEFIPSHYRLGFVYVLQVLDVQVPIPENRAKLRDVVNRGLELAPDNAGLVGLSGQLARYDGDNALAERRFHRAIEIDPSNIPARILYMMFVGDQGNPEKAVEIGLRTREIDPLNPLLLVGAPFAYIDLWDTRRAMQAAAHVKAIPGLSELPLMSVVKLLLLGDLAGSVRDSRAFMRSIARETEQAYGYPSLYFDLGILEAGDAALQLWRRHDSDTAALNAIEVQQLLAHGEIAAARARAIEILEENEGYTGYWNNYVVARLATDALIERGDAKYAVELIERLAPVYASYKARSDIDAREFSPAPFPVKSNYSSFPAIFFPDYAHALRAAGDAAGAVNMLGHLEAILALRRQRGLYLEERYTAEAHALRGRHDAALDALEKAERDRTIYHNWPLFLLHSSIFSGIRDQPRFGALVDRVRAEMSRQRAQLNAGDEASGEVADGSEIHEFQTRDGHKPFTPWGVPPPLKRPCSICYSH